MVFKILKFKLQLVLIIICAVLFYKLMTSDKTGAAVTEVTQDITQMQAEAHDEAQDMLKTGDTAEYKEKVHRDPVMRHLLGL